MDASLPYPYTVSFMQPGKTEPSITHMVNTVAGEIRELCRYEVTVAAEWTENIRAGVRHKCISYDGGLYVSVRSDVGNTLGRLPVFAGGDYLFDPSFGFNILGKARLSRGEENLLQKAFVSDMIRPPRFRSTDVLLNTNQRHNETIARECFNSLIFADGQLWRKVPWIGLELSPYFDDVKVDVVTGLSGFDVPGTDIAEKLFMPPNVKRLFGLQDMERVRFHAQGSNLLSTFKNLVSMGDLPEINSEEDLILRSVRFAVHKTIEDVGDMPTDVLNDWLSMRDAYADQVNGAMIELPDDLEETLRRFAPRIKDQRSREHIGEVIQTLDVYHAERSRGQKVDGPSIWNHDRS